MAQNRRNSSSKIFVSGDITKQTSKLKLNMMFHIFLIHILFSKQFIDEVKLPMDGQFEAFGKFVIFSRSSVLVHYHAKHSCNMIFFFNL